MRRVFAALSVTAVLSLTACGGSGDDEAAAPADDIAGVSVTGDFGESPEIEVTDLEVDEAVDAVVIEGDGAEVTGDSTLRYRFRIVYASDGEEVSSNYTADSPTPLDVAAQPAVLVDALVGTTLGSRVVLALSVDDLLSDEEAEQVGLRTDDDLVMVLDLVSEVAPPLEGPDGEAVSPPADAPSVVEDDGVVTGIGFDSAPKKTSGELEVTTLVEGSGEPVAEGDSVTVDYLGVVYGGDEPFDESYSREPATFTLAKGSLIDGWVEGLDGVTVGSRVLLEIPAEQGYGAQGSGDIPGGATLVFVIDVLAAGA